MSLTDIAVIVTSAGIGALIVLVIVIYFFNNLDKVFLIWNVLAKFLFNIGRARIQHLVATSLTTYLNTSILQFQKEAPSVFQKSLRLRWITTDKEFADLQEGEIILYVKQNPDQDQVLVNAAFLYIREGVIAQSRPYIEMRLLQGIDVALAQKFLIKSPGAYRYLQEFQVAAMQNDARTLEFYNLAETLEEYGVLTRVVLREFSGLSLMLKGRTPSSRIREETVAFARFVGRVIDRQEEIIPLRFSGKLFKITLALIAQTARVNSLGISVYKRKFRGDIESGTTTIYLLARGMQHVQLARSVARWALDQKLITQILPSSFYESLPSGEELPCTCIACFSAQVSTSVGLSPVDEVYSALAEIVPQVLTGDVEVIAIAREKGVRTKILVRALDGGNAVGFFVGANGSNIIKLKAVLSTTEEFDFCQWDTSTEELVAEVLYPLRRDEIAKIDVDEINARVTVFVKERSLIGVAVGTRGINVQLAQRVTGLTIQIDADPNILSPEDEALAIISQEIPDIEAGTISIKKLVRRPSEMTKVVVESESINSPAEHCNKIRKTIARNSALNETVQFVNWSDNLEQRIICALAVNPGEVDFIKIDTAKRQAFIQFTTNEEFKKALGKFGSNVKTAEEITNYRLKLTVRK
jgi:transcription antitermination factor NusA-like protein